MGISFCLKPPWKILRTRQHVPRSSPDSSGFQRGQGAMSSSYQGLLRGKSPSSSVSCSKKAFQVLLPRAVFSGMLWLARVLLSSGATFMVTLGAWPGPSGPVVMPLPCMPGRQLFLASVLSCSSCMFVPQLQQSLGCEAHKQQNRKPEFQDEAAHSLSVLQGLLSNSLAVSSCGRRSQAGLWASFTSALIPVMRGPHSWAVAQS